MNELKTAPESITIRVYGVLIDEKRILIADEFKKGIRFSKFPGGGLELGEGIHDCLIREWREELHQTIGIVEHFYTTDFFQISAFNPRQQVISIYFLVQPVDEPINQVSEVPFDFSIEKGGTQSFRWVALNNFSEKDVTFPIDKLVAKMICEKFT